MPEKAAKENDMVHMEPAQAITENQSMAPSWWALYTRHQHEKAVAEMLAAKDFAVLLPLYKAVRRWKDRQKVLSVPLFPCYVFVRGGLDRRLQIITTPGILNILYRGDQVAKIPDTEIEAIQRTIAGNLRAEPHPFLKCGDRVRVVRGPLEGVTGILTRKKNLCRLVLSVNTLAQSIAIEINASDVVPDRVESMYQAGFRDFRKQTCTVANEHFQRELAPSA